MSNPYEPPPRRDWLAMAILCLTLTLGTWCLIALVMWP